MRLRSPQVVFLLLLVCSVRQWERPAFRLDPDVTSRQTSNLGEDRQAHADRDGSAYPGIGAEQPVRALHLPAEARAAHRIPWTMRRPALASAAVVAVTSFLRA